MSDYAKNPTLVQTLEIKPSSTGSSDHDQNKDINGLTILDGELYLLVGEYKTRVEVYDSTSFEHKRQFPLDEISVKATYTTVNSRDLVSCEKEKCLYAIGWIESESSAMVKTDPAGKILKRWSVDASSGLLSVTSRPSVIFTNGDTHKLLEYSPDGAVLREITLPAAETGRGCACAGPARLEDFHINYPWHSVELTGGQLVVAHGYLHFAPQHRVCLVDESGKFQKSYGGKSGSGQGQMNQPNHVVVDGKGNVLVADKFNDRVLLLNSELAFGREILSKGKQLSGHPHRIFLEESKGRLFVAFSHESSDKVLVFNVK